MNLLVLLKIAKLIAFGLVSLIALAAVGPEFLRARLLTLDPELVKFGGWMAGLATALEGVEVLRLKRGAK